MNINQTHLHIILPSNIKGTLVSDRHNSDSVKTGTSLCDEIRKQGQTFLFQTADIRQMFYKLVCQHVNAPKV